MRTLNLLNEFVLTIAGSCYIYFFFVLVSLVIHLDPLGSTWIHLGQGLYLSECQLLVSDPGAVNQMWHCDAWLAGDKTNVKAVATLSRLLTFVCPLIQQNRFANMP